MFLRIKSAVFLLSFLSIITLAHHSYGIARNSIELISDGDTLALSKKEAQELSKRLIEDPLGLLNELKKYQHDLVKLDGVGISLSCEVIQKKIKINREQNPLFSIGECDSGMCGFSRRENSSRSFYEKTVVSYLKKYKNQDRINFVAFASGGLFQELIILTHAVCLHDIYNINIHLVDPVYGSFIEALSTIDNQSSVINVARYNNFNFHNYSVTKVPQKAMQKVCEIYLTVKQEQFRQFVSIVKQLSDNHVKVFVHKSAEAYCEFCTQHPEMRADIISAMDLEPEFRYETAIKDYYSLVYQALKKGGIAILADNDLGPEKLNMIDYVVHRAPNVVIISAWLFLETLWRHVVDLSEKTIYSPTQYSNRYNSIFVSVHSKKAECSDECLQNIAHTFAQCCNNYSALNAALKKLDNNKFVTHRHEFNGMSATKKAVYAGALFAGGIYAARALKN